MAGGLITALGPGPAGTVLAIAGVLALLIGAAELVARLLPRPRSEQFDQAHGDIVRPVAEPEVQRLRDGAAL